MSAISTLLEKFTLGTAKVSIQSSDARLLFTRMSRTENSTPYVLAADAVVDSRDITLVDSTGLVVGDELIIFQTNGNPVPIYYYGVIVAKVGDVLTLDSPIDQVYTETHGLVFHISSDLNVDGSSTRVLASYSNPSTSIIEVTRIIIHMLDAIAMDDGKFGGLTALTNGVVFRKKQADGTYSNYFNVTTNGEIKELCYDGEYSDKAAAGEYGFTARLTFTKLGSPIKIHEGEALELIIQDNLTGLISFKATLEGKLVG